MIFLYLIFVIDTGLVRDAQGRKMSKTTGNVIDPIDTMEKFGCDTLRFALVSAFSFCVFVASRDVDIHRSRDPLLATTCLCPWRSSKPTGPTDLLVAYIYRLSFIPAHDDRRNFANKLWNVGKYIQNALSFAPTDERAALAVTGPMDKNELASLPLAERYIVASLHAMVAKVRTSHYHICAHNNTFHAALTTISLRRPQSLSVSLACER